MKIYVFDFDGTLTLKDSMMSVIIHQRGKLGMYWALLRQIHLIILMFLGKYSNHKTKEHLLDYCFGGMSEKELNTFFTDFASKHQGILNPTTMAKLQEAMNDRDARTFVITASPRLWVEKFFEPKNKPTILGTELEFDSNGFTGHFLTPNCYGQEKVNRLIKEIPSLYSRRNDYYVIAYGDSRGDREMFQFADEYTLIKK